MLDLGAARIAVTSPILKFQEQLDFIYGRRSDNDAGFFADIRVALWPGPAWRLGRRQVALWSEGVRPFEPYPLHGALPLFEWGSNWLLAQRLNAYLLLHAGVLARGEHALILPAAPGSGKSTLTCALHLAGWRFLSDEFGVVDPESGHVRPLLKPAALKNRSIDVIGGLPGAVLGPVFPKTRKGDVAHFVPNPASIADRHRTATPRLVIFPRYRDGAPLRSNTLSTAEAAMRLGLNSFNYRSLGPIGFHAVTRLARSVKACELEYGDLGAAIDHIEHLFVAAP
ncbi:HprK-related kinase A [Aromatoleum aromaticum]|nr:HprK-related kinase A [Aromatoleum aromaticum]